MDGSNMRGRMRFEIPEDWIRKQIAAGLNGRQMAQRLGCSDVTVYARMREHGIAPPEQDLKAHGQPRIDRNRITELWNAGVEVDVIAARCGCTRDSVRRLVKQLKLQARPKGWRPERRDAEAIPKQAEDVLPVPSTRIASASLRVDAEIMRSKGHYSALAAIEQKHRLRRGQALARWHVLRVG